MFEDSLVIDSFNLLSEETNSEVLSDIIFLKSYVLPLSSSFDKDDIPMKCLFISSTSGVSFLRSLPDLSPRKTFKSELTMDMPIFYQIYQKNNQ